MAWWCRILNGTDKGHGFPWKYTGQKCLAAAMDIVVKISKTFYWEVSCRSMSKSCREMMEPPISIIKWSPEVYQAENCAPMSFATWAHRRVEVCTSSCVTFSAVTYATWRTHDAAMVCSSLFLVWEPIWSRELNSHSFISLWHMFGKGFEPIWLCRKEKKDHPGMNQHHSGPGCQRVPE